MEFWVLNTDEAEAEGRDADKKMCSLSRVAAWGETFGAEGKLGKPEAGDRVFFYKNNVGVVAMATFDHTDPLPLKRHFRDAAQGRISSSGH